MRTTSRKIFKNTPYFWNVINTQYFLVENLPLENAVLENMLSENTIFERLRISEYILVILDFLDFFTNQRLALFLHSLINGCTIKTFEPLRLGR